jgi:para-aminobenzoate synthetase/4-amino-4-deoxychorismate lyase
VDKEAHRVAVERVRAYLAAGDSYQVNFTFGLTAPFEGSGQAWFQALCRAQQADYCAYLDLGGFQILSASPELFFRLDGDLLETRPMKGTRRRSPDPVEDVRLREELAASSKDRAENLMIVDLLRNDMGRISRTGSVNVTGLFKVEPYPTVWQMTSSIESKTRAPVTDILKALFPCGSVTGAPKVRSMQIIRELEQAPRGVYCGAVGYWMPGRKAQFNVAIRTATIDAATGCARYGVGGAITWDSEAGAEFDECLAKAAVLDAADGEVELLESLLFDGSYFLLDRHLARLAASADFFGFRVDINGLENALVDASASMPPGARKVRLRVSRFGALTIEHAPVKTSDCIRLAISETPIDRHSVFLHHKTTRREVYNRALAAHPDADDVLLWNSSGEITETCFGNIVADFAGKRVTPPVHCGLLPGTMRADLLERGLISERVIRREDLAKATALYMINSVRKWVPVELIAARKSVSRNG